METDNYRKVVLIVDDEPDVLHHLEALIKNGGYIPLKAANATIALKLIRSLMPDLIVLDTIMPDMDGFELCKEIREIPYMADTPIILFTAYDLIQGNYQAAKVGANAIVAKPDSIQYLISTIKILLSQSPANPKH